MGTELSCGHSFSKHEHVTCVFIHMTCVYVVILMAVICVDVLSGTQIHTQVGGRLVTKSIASIHIFEEQFK